MATLSFYAGSTSIDNLAGSGLGFFGSSFGSSVTVSAFQDTSFITNSDGTTQGASANNVKFLDSASGITASATAGTGIKFIPNDKATLNIRFTHDSAIKTQNVRVCVFDRYDKDYPASGVTTRVAELIHTSALLSVEGSGDEYWWGSTGHDGTDVQGSFQGSPNPDVRLPINSYTVGGSGIVVPLSDSPCASGSLAGNGTGSQQTATQHDWYIAMSASPDSIGSKTQYGLYVSLEYL
jgi:hypothetical protein